MKRFDELTKKQQKSAIDYALYTLAQSLAMGLISMEDTDLQSRINAAMDSCDKLFAEAIRDACYKDLLPIAKDEARRIIYLDTNEYSVHISTIDGWVTN